MIARVVVGYTDQRPIIPDEDARVVLVSGETEDECRLIACQIVGCDTEMVTSAVIRDILEI